MKYFSFFKYIYILLALFTFSGSSFGVEVRFDAIYGYDLNANSLAVEQNGVGQERYAYDEVRNFIHYGIQRPSSVLNQVNIEYESDYRLYYGTTNLCYRCINYSVENLQEKTLDGSFFASIGFGNASKGGGTETVQRWMSQAELKATKETGLIRGGRDGTHFVTDSANSNAKRARQRSALPQTPEVKVTLEVPAGKFSSPSRVEPAFNMPGGGMERTATGKIKATVKKVK